MRLGVLFLTLLLLPLNGGCDSSPYAGHEGREIKALSADEVADLLAGRGMGLAKAAELNHYPGPRHVLDLAKRLALSQKQQEQTQDIYKHMQAEAARVGRLIVEKERLLDLAYARQDIGEAFLRELIGDIARHQGELRFVHLRAHLQQRQILTRSQIERYDALRGYGQAGAHQHRTH